ncbi:hypothetical protein X798_04654 [Onchocerca flexuosa]|uniref:SPRY domain-containing protein n=1 Tax=Onchocerca flexuosa TaxID=387005 RepID=A0A238BSN6_9BILA|nr:hypothetical protein X798_04654 [Onchocerca flexuosa]
MFESCFPPLRMCLECVQGPSFSMTQSNGNFQNEAHPVRLDTVFMGDDVVLLKNGQRICGSGAALGTAPIVQNKAYFQVYPIIYVGDNAILDIAFRSFSYNAPEGYEEIMLEQTIL